MTVKLIVLKNGENIISSIREGFYEDRLICYVLENPCSISINGTYKILDDEANSDDQYSVSLMTWPRLSNDKMIELVPDAIITIVEPMESLKNIYNTQVLGSLKNEDSASIDSGEQSDSDL